MDRPDKIRMQVLELSDPRWLAFVLSRQEATAFHHPAWASVLAKTYGYRPLVTAVSSPEGKIVAGAPFLMIQSRLTGHRGISLPFTDHCPPLGSNQASLSHLSEELVSWRTRSAENIIEIRGEFSDIPLQSVHNVTAGVRHWLPLEVDSDRVMKRFHRSQVQRAIRKAQRDGVEVRFADSLKEMEIFYDLHLQTRRRLGVPVQPKRLFEAIWSDLIQDGLGFVCLAYKNSRAIAGAVFLAWNDTVIYKYGASDLEYRRYRPNHLVMWTGIQWACARGFGKFDFGKTDLSNQGLRNFKNGWGTTELPLVYSFIGGGERTGFSDTRGRILTTVIQHSPAIVCRGIGELFYGHYG